MTQISVIIPTYNRPLMLHTAIKSVLHQTCQDFEIIVVDDASTCNVREILDFFGDQRIKYISHRTNRGEAAARNSGLIAAESEYIAFLDDDDEWLPDKLEIQIDFLDRSPSKTGLVYTGITHIELDSKRIIRTFSPKLRGKVHEQLLKGNFISTPSSVLIRKECINKVGMFDESIAYGNDYDMWIRISKHFDFECISDSLIHHYYHSGMLTNNFKVRTRGYDEILRKYPGLLDLSKYSNLYFSSGFEMCSTGDMFNGITALLKAVKLNPFKYQIYPYILSGMFGRHFFSGYVRCTEVLKNLFLPTGRL